jgi:hypothetical protein
MNGMKKFVLLLVIIFLCMAFLYGRPTIVGDGVTYYALTISLLRDGDFNVTNERRQFSEVMTRLNPTTGKQAPLYSCGFALLYAPFIAAGEGLRAVIPSLLEWKPYAQNQRIPWIHTFGIFLGSLVFGFLTMQSTFAILNRRFQQPFWIAFCIVILLFIGTPLIFYTFVIPSYSHAADAFLTTFIFVLVFINPTPGWKTRIRNLFLGLALALSVSLRNVNIVLVLPAVAGVLFLNLKDGNGIWFLEWKS